MLTRREKPSATGTSSVYILEGNGTPFLKKDDVVRFSSMSMAGATTQVDIEGPALLSQHSFLHRLINGQQPVGSQEEEFEIRLTGAGKVVVNISVQSPTSGYPDVTEHVIAVS